MSGVRTLFACAVIAGAIAVVLILGAAGVPDAVPAIGFAFALAILAFELDRLTQ